MRMKTLIALLVLCVAGAACGARTAGGGGGADDDDDVVSDDDDDGSTGYVRIDAVDPSNGLATAINDDVLVTGTGFTGSTVVQVDGVDATGCVVDSPVEMHCDFPVGGAAGRVDVAADDPVTGTFTLTTGYTYTAVRNESDLPQELDFCNIQFPTAFTMTHGTQSQDLFSQFFEGGETDALSTAAPGFLVEVGFGPNATDPIVSNAWRFFEAAPNAGYMFSNNNDEYLGHFTIADGGTYLFTWRISKDGGIGFTYCDLDGAGSNGGLTYSGVQLGSVTAN